MMKSSRLHCRSNSLNFTFTRALLSLGAAWAASIVVAASGQSAPDGHPKLPAGEGRDVMIRVCSQCHEPERAADQQMDEAGWKTLVDQMAAQGADATEDEFRQIVQYLAKAFPPAK